MGSFEDRWEEGVWLGRTIRDGMALVGTSAGVYKVGTFKRQPDGEQWSLDLVRSVAGSPQQPDPNTESRRITTFAKKKMEGRQEDKVKFQPPVYATPMPRAPRLSKKDVDRYKPTPGCPACRAIAAGKEWRSAHTAECRTRIEGLMPNDPDRRHLVGTANLRKDRFCEIVIGGGGEAEETTTASNGPSVGEPRSSLS